MGNRSNRAKRRKEKQGEYRLANPVADAKSRSTVPPKSISMSSPEIVPVAVPEKSEASQMPSGIKEPLETLQHEVNPVSAGYRKRTVRLWFWIGKKWRWDALLSVGVFGTIKLGEYAVAMALLVISGMAVISKISQWDGTGDEAFLTSWIRRGLYTVVGIAVIFLAVITDKVRGDTAWSHLMDGLTAETPADPIVHIAPENSVIWSSTPGQTRGVFSLHLSSTS